MASVKILLAEPIALPSVNPAFLPPRHPHAGQERVADYLAALGARAGLDIELQPVLPHRPNLLARLRPVGRIRRRDLLAPHLDTVNAAPIEQLTPRTQGVRIFGRGACDTKGAVAAFFSAVCELAQCDARPRETEIVFVGLEDEEYGQAGSRFLGQRKSAKPWPGATGRAALFLRCGGAGARGHSQRGLWTGRYCPGAHRGRVDFQCPTGTRAGNVAPLPEIASLNRAGCLLSSAHGF